MADEDLLGDMVSGKNRASPWAVAAFVSACAFTGGAILLLVLSWA